MENVIIKSDGNISLKEDFVKIKNDEIPAVDIPYFINFYHFKDKFTGELVFVNNKETIKSFEDEYLRLNFGIRSGKVYKVEFKKGTFLNNSKINVIKKELFSNYLDNRYKNNISLGLNILRDLFALIK